MGSTLDGKAPAGADEWRRKRANQDKRDRLNRLGADVMETLAPFSGPSDELCVPALGSEWANILAPSHQAPAACSKCGKQDETVDIVCTGCQQVYCSRECKLADWNEGHKKQCLAATIQMHCSAIALPDQKSSQDASPRRPHSAHPARMLQHTSPPSCTSPQASPRRPYTARHARPVHYTVPKVFAQSQTKANSTPLKHTLRRCDSSSPAEKEQKEMEQAISDWEQRTLSASARSPRGPSQHSKHAAANSHVHSLRPSRQLFSAAGKESPAFIPKVTFSVVFRLHARL